MLSIVIPSYNSANVLAANLPGLIEYLKSKEYEFEIIVVDDGSQDNGATEKVCTEQNCIYLENIKNLGKGAAVKKGMLHSKGEFRVFTDCDIPFKYENIDRIVYYLDFKEFDIALGNRTLKDSVYFSEIPYLRKIASKIYTFIIGRFITTGFFDTQCGLKGFRGYIADDLFSKSRINGFAFDVEMIYIALKRNYDIKSVPVQIRNFEESSISLLKQTFRMLLDILYIKYNQMMGKYNEQ